METFWDAATTAESQQNCKDEDNDDHDQVKTMIIAIVKIGGWKPFGTPHRPQNHGKTATGEADQDADHDNDDGE